MAVDWHGPEIVARIRAGAMRGVGVGIGIVERRAVELILQTSKTGRVYRRRDRAHQASAPGEPFASDTGQTVNARDLVLDPALLRGQLIFRGWNAVRLEHGTRHMAARPFARRALAETGAQVIDAVMGEIAVELRASGGGR